MMAILIALCFLPIVFGMAADIDDDCAEMLFDESFASHNIHIDEALANGESAASIVRHSAARKFNREDPLEAASAEYILRLTS